MTDPWLAKTKENNSEKVENSQSSSNTQSDKLEEVDANQNIQTLEFEDNFAPNQQQNHENHQPLPDSVEYLKGLENKLEKLRKGSKLIEALAAKREDCMRTLLDDKNGITSTEQHAALDTPMNESDSTVNELLRHFQPVQPVTVGETVNIVQYDQLNNDDEYEEDTTSEENNQ